MDTTRAKVSIVVTTFNHVKYIEQAIESVLSQAADFPYELIISEDASDDGTQEVVRQIANAHKGRIQLIISEKNLKSNEVVARGLRAANGEFVSLLDGDDYWTSRSKLQRQVDFLNRHPECSAVFFNAKVAIGEEVMSQSWTSHAQAPFLDMKEIWRGNPFATCGGMMRANILRRVPVWYDGFVPMITDWPLYILCAEHGRLAFVDEDAGVYRLHDGGLFSSIPTAGKLDWIESFYNSMNAVLGYRYDRLARASASRFFFEWAEEYAKRGERKLGLNCLKRSFRAGGIGLDVSKRDLIRLWARLVFPNTSS